MGPEAGIPYAPHRLADVRRLGLDLYLFSTYKTFGTHIGVMWGKPAVLAALHAQGHYFNADLPHYRLNPAGPLHAQIGALAGIGDYLDALDAHHFGAPAAGRHERAARVFDLFAAHETRLANRVLDTLRELPGVRVIGRPRAEPGRRAATIAFTASGKNPEQIVRQLQRRKVAARNGHFYALRCVEALGIADPAQGVVRLSLVHYNTDEEVDRLTAGLIDALG